MLLNTKRLLVFLLLVVMAVTVACGDDSEDDGGDDGDNGSAVTETTGEATEASEPTEAAEPTEAEDGGDEGEVEGDPAAGQQVAQTAGCIACHSVDGSALVGPTWQGLYGSEVTLADGSTVTADAAYITESIKNPNAKVHEGFTPTMPTFPQLTDDDIANLVAYIQTLE